MPRGADRPRILPLFLPFAGCPGRCAFCAARLLSPDPPLEPPELARRAEELAAGLDPADRRPVQLALYGGSVTALPRARLIGYLEALVPLLAGPVTAGLRISTRPDALAPEPVRELAARGLRTVELGAPSMDDGMLARLGRGHSAEQVGRAVRLLRGAGLEVGLQMMYGLPGESLAGSVASLERALALGPDFLRLHPLLVLAGTPLAAEWRSHGPWPLDEPRAARWGAVLLARAEEAGVPVARLGLLDTAELRRPGTVLAGPAEPGLRDRAESLRWRGRLLRRMAEEEPRAGAGSDRVERWGVNPADLGWAVGPGRRNEAALARRLGRVVRIDAVRGVPRGGITRIA